ncbi:MAG: cytochrome c family protein [Candidatus Marinimicrobia bacterium]|nr:cytochrome c family protein [Candidatus Neomarinimicrobiota bacterium]
MKNLRDVIVLMCMGLFVSGAVTALAEDSDPALLIGAKRCGMCHKKDLTGNQLAIWQAGPHAKAFELLASDEAKAVGAKLGIENPQQSGACLKCHSTAYNGTEEVQNELIAVEDGVQCESCHGAGKNYKSKQIMEDRAQCIENGMVYPATKSCAKCHNDASPTWKPDRYTTKDGKPTGFDVEQAFDKIKHPNPAKAE